MSADNLAFCCTEKIAIKRALQQIPAIPAHISASVPIDSAFSPVTMMPMCDPEKEKTDDFRENEETCTFFDLVVSSRKHVQVSL